ncbi:odorant receptor 82a [Harpegnathos saltator]|uniref:odorant receptor 82a n=1 Tax=Harpegnathos saltator TaxID=610380 RepID=UPI000948A596|nr:odorant receptor 82a [Harpegnathos saltator]
MDILPVNFKVLWFCGAWKERKDENIVLAFLYTCYRYAVFLLIYESTIFEVIELFRTRNHMSDVTEGLFLTSTFVTLCLKYANFLLRRNELSALLEYLRMKICQPRNFKERLIIDAHSRKAKWSALSFLIISQATSLALMIAPVLETNAEERVLPLKLYVPYSITRLFPYAATYLQHVLTLFYAVMLNVSFDSLVYGLTIHACGQIELLGRRLKDDLAASETLEMRPGSNTSIEECVRHHVLMHAFVKRVGALFVWTVAVLFFFSLIIFCTSIFLITKTKLFSVEFFSLILYFSGIMLQIFFYCWYGNELELKSSGIARAIYFSNWTMVTPQERKSLMLIMINCQKGFVFSYHGTFTLCLDTFTWIFKTSYSAFNLLQQASD